MKYDMLYIEDKDGANQMNLIVDTDKNPNLLAEIEANIPVVSWYTPGQGWTRKAQKYIVPLNCKNVSAVLVSTAPIGSLKDRKHLGKNDAKYQKALVDATEYFRCIAEIQIYSGNGVLPPKNGYGSLLEALRWDNKVLRPMDQLNYVRRPHPGGKTLVRNARGELENTGKIAADGSQTWISPIDGHVITTEEYLAGIESRIAPRHHNDDKGTLTLYHIDETYMNIQEMTYVRRMVTDDAVRKTEAELEMQPRPIVSMNDEHLVYTHQHPAGTGLILAYLKVPKVPEGICNHETYEYGITATGDVTDAKRNNCYKGIRSRLCSRLIPALGKSIQRETPSRHGYMTRHVKQEDGKYKNIRVTCEVCGDYYKPDTQGNQVCQTCGLIYEMTEEEIAEELNLAIREATNGKPARYSYNEDDMTYEEETELEDEVVETYYDDDADNDDTSAQTEQRHSLLGGKAVEGKMAAIEARLLRNQQAWKDSLNTAPRDELKAKARAQEKKAKHEECTQQNKAAKKTKHVDVQEALYLAKWHNAQKNYVLRTILAYVKDGITDTADLKELVPCEVALYYKCWKQLVENGRLTSTVTGRRNNLAIVPVIRPVREQNPAKYDGRKYGNLEYKRGTIQKDCGLRPVAVHVTYAYDPKKTAKEYVKEWKGTNYPEAEHVLGPKAKPDSDYPLY